MAQNVKKFVLKAEKSKHKRNKRRKITHNNDIKFINRHTMYGLKLKMRDIVGLGKICAYLAKK